jgi:hypothetical protein
VVGASTTPVTRRPLSPGVRSQPVAGAVGALGQVTVPLMVGVQLLSQPSPLAVLPSSHASLPSCCPLPHTPPGRRQSGSQPSPEVELPSSQASAP